MDGLELREMIELAPVLVLGYLPEKTVFDMVNAALEGSEFAIEAWRIIEKCYLQKRSPTGEEFDKFDELLDRAYDDLEGPGLRIDFTKGKGNGRIYR